MPFGLIVAIIVVVGFAIWGVVLLLSTVREKPAEAVLALRKQHRSIRRRSAQ
jgi:hypothetical protein